MHQRSIALLAFGLGVVATPVVAILVHQMSDVAIARDKGDAGFGRGADESDFNEPNNDGIGNEPNSDGIGAVVVQPAHEDLDPKQVYLDLVKSKLSLMTPEELQRETDALRSDLIEMQATEKLRASKRQLEELIEEHPTTTAAKIARQMLRSLDAPIENPRRRETFDADTYPSPKRHAPPADDETVQPRRRGNERDGATLRRGNSFDVPVPEVEESK